MICKNIFKIKPDHMFYHHDFFIAAFYQKWKLIQFVFADAIIDWKIYKICRTVFLFIMQVYYFRILHIAKTLYKYKKCEQLCILLVIPIENCCDVSNFLHFD